MRKLLLFLIPQGSFDALFQRFDSLYLICSRFSGHITPQTTNFFVCQSTILWDEKPSSVMEIPPPEDHTAQHSLVEYSFFVLVWFLVEPEQEVVYVIPTK